MNLYRTTATAAHGRASRPYLRFLVLMATFVMAASAQVKQEAKTYTNPILFADYSDPDIIRDGNDFYIIASSFHFVPGIPILHSKDLVHWEISGHVVERLKMSPAYDMKDGMRYASGVWAPSVRFHNGLFYVYFPTPDEGIFVSTAPKMTGPWSEPVVVLPGAGWEDPCPFWDDNGDAYLVHSKLRAGPLILHRMSADGKTLLDDGKVIVRDPVHLPTLEGPKFYKRNGWYYIFAPMGGVATGAQVVLRSRNIYGPYEHRIVLAKGATSVNGPHQGGWVEAPDGSGWFLHFQQRGAHGRILWLEPLAWKDDWPLIGISTGDDAPGQPVSSYTLPFTMPWDPATKLQTSDEFDSAELSPMWEWNHNPDNERWSLTERKGFLSLHPNKASGLLQARNTLTESMQDERLEVTARLDTTRLASGDKAGLSAFDKSLSAIGVQQNNGRLALFFSIGAIDTAGPELPRGKQIVLLRVRIMEDHATYSYSTDEGQTFHPLGTSVTLHFSWWKGARPALFAYNPEAASNGAADFDWVHYKALAPEE